MRESVFGRRAYAENERILVNSRYGFVARTLSLNGNELTFFRTDFLDLANVAWHCAERFSADQYHEQVTDEVLKSIQKNGGFFLSKHYLSLDPDGKVMSKKGDAIDHITGNEAKEIASSFSIPYLASQLMFGMIYDVLGKWLMKIGALTMEEWLDSPTTQMEQERLLTRDCGGWCIKDILGDIFKHEWTQEEYGDYIVVRAGQSFSDEEGKYPSRARRAYDKNSLVPEVRVRAFLYYR